MPIYPAIEAYARTHGIAFQSIEELLQKEEIYKLFESNIEECQREFSSYEKIKRFTLLSTPFSMETGELTDTLKLRRPVIAKHYAEVIDKMHEE